MNNSTNKVVTKEMWRQVWNNVKKVPRKKLLKNNSNLEVETVELTNTEVQFLIDYAAYYDVNTLQMFFDDFIADELVNSNDFLHIHKKLSLFKTSEEFCDSVFKNLGYFPMFIGRKFPVKIIFFYNLLVTVTQRGPFNLLGIRTQNVKSN